MNAQDYKKESMAKACGKALPISRKQAILVGNLIRHKNVQKAKIILEKVSEEKMAVPYTIFNHGVAHKPGIGPGRYPVRTALEILQLLKSAESNAQFKGLNTARLVISDLCVNRASVAWHYGRQRRIRMKRCHVDIVLTEEPEKKNEKKEEGMKQK
jgi:large subunit ribosomal protein L22